VKATIMSLGVSSPASHRVQVRPEPKGLFTAALLGLSDLSATASTREDAVDQLRILIQQEVESGSLVTVEIHQENPLMSRFGWADKDPSFDDYLNEIRKFREDVDRRDLRDSGSAECSDTSSTPTT
jgi:hypothetical protein